ncbi:Hsp70 family protein [Methanobrevibacter sp. V74]|uniref:Hsp70 family protein n=1 Tax=Methanobrevibacter sp. V74 TaxID=3064279 RepID=UPI0027372CEE|nr:Hsp70 family protein [Methanobrevibacter sp. V74]
MSNNSDELRTKTVDFGIDLGTTTSIIAHCEGNDTPIVPNLISNRNFTPSAVAMDEEGNVLVGDSAKRQVLLDPDNATAEFKLNMGMNKGFHFKDSDKTLLPEELSAEVLKDLKNSVYKQLDLKVHSVVITVPADFGPIQNEATKKAAELAGFKNTWNVMEPVAAAYAYYNLSNEDGTWLIYDLGGGTFDVSIVKLEDDEFENLAHSGDEHLGGNLIDWDIVFKIFAKKISADLGLMDFNKKNEEKYRKAFAKLKGAAEEAKKDLSRLDKSRIFVDSLLVHENEIYDFKYNLTKDELEGVMESYIKRTINHCNDALKKAKLNVDDIDYIILVGGSTLSPVIRENLEKSFDIPLKYDIDPTTVVAKGSALFAGTIPDPYVELSSGSFALKLDYDATGPIDEEFFVSGEVLSDQVDDFEGFTIEAINIKTKRSTGKISVEDDGFFEFELMPEDESNKYSINLYDPNGILVELDENSANAIEYTAGFEPTIILPHTLGLGLYDDTLFVLAKEGSPLPYHNMEPFKTTSEVTKGDETSFISMPLYNGTAKIASNNQKVGELIISGVDVEKTMVKGSEITVTVDIDESRVMKFDVNVLDIGQKFPFKIDPNLEILNFNEVNNKFIKAKSNYEEVKSKCSANDATDEIKDYLNQIDEENIIENIEDFMDGAENDDGALNQANKLINKLNEILSNINKFFDEKNQFEEVKNIRDNVEKLVNENGSFEDREEFDTLSRQLDEAIENEDSLKVNQIIDSLIALQVRCTPETQVLEDIKNALLYLVMFAEYKDEDESLVNDLKQKATEALENDDAMAMANIGQKLMNLAIIDPNNPGGMSAGVDRT